MWNLVLQFSNGGYIMALSKGQTPNGKIQNTKEFSKMTTRYTFKALATKIRLSTIFAKYRLQGYDIYVTEKSELIGCVRTLLIAEYEKTIELNFDIKVDHANKRVIVNCSDKWVRYSPYELEF
jgi:hypothetical protein